MASLAPKHEVFLDVIRHCVPSMTEVTVSFQQSHGNKKGSAEADPFL